MKLNIDYIKKISLLVFAFFVLPAISWAVLGTPPTTLKDLAVTIKDIANLLVPVFVTLAFAAFLWGIAKTILHSDSEDVRKKGRVLMVYGLVSLFVIVSLWGILNMAQKTFF